MLAGAVGPETRRISRDRVLSMLRHAASIRPAAVLDDGEFQSVRPRTTHDHLRRGERGDLRPGIRVVGMFSRWGERRHSALAVQASFPYRYPRRTGICPRHREHQSRGNAPGACAVRRIRWILAQARAGVRGDVRNAPFRSLPYGPHRCPVGECPRSGGYEG